MGGSRIWVILRSKKRSRVGEERSRTSLSRLLRKGSTRNRKGAGAHEGADSGVGEKSAQQIYAHDPAAHKYIYPKANYQIFFI